MPGTRADGFQFVEAAVAAGAAAYVGLAPTQGSTLEQVPRIESADASAAAGLIAAAFHGFPSHRLDLVGVTGTNGKTSIAHLLEAVWTAAEVPAAVAGTIEERWPGFRRPAAMTTAAAADLQQFLADASRAGARAAAIEVSSHALDQKRVAGCRFRAAVFTNLTRDHLDYHGDEDHYFASKAALFRCYLDRDGGAAVLNADDARVASLIGELRDYDVWSFSCQPGSQARARVVRASMDLSGIHAQFDLDGRGVEVRSRLLGAPNLSNLLATAATAAALGVDADAISDGLSAAAPVPGRLERIGSAQGEGPVVLVDYAHTPDALQRSLETLRTHLHGAAGPGADAGRLIVVIGCGGDRDRGKRPLMGAIAAELADLAVLTSDNPRSEDPLEILLQLEQGASTRTGKLTAEDLEHSASRGYFLEVDRLTAIERAIAAAGPKDVVLVAGKGHEDYQEIAGERRHFDDRQTVAAIQLRGRGQ